METPEVIVSQDKLSEVFCRHNYIARDVRKESCAQGVADITGQPLGSGRR